MTLPSGKVGSLCVIHSEQRRIPVEIVSLSPTGHVAMPLDRMEAVRLGDPVYLEEAEATVPIDESVLGQIVDSRGFSYETGEGPGQRRDRVPLYGSYLNPLERQIITDPLDLGIRSLNACLSCGKGQRQGIFSGSGVGKSVLLGMIARYTAADVVVIGLIGERGREVREFLEHDLGEKGRRKSVVVVETSDRSPVRRVRGAFTAIAVAEYFRNRGANVLLLMDSLTRFAMAQREIGIAAGEPPTSKGYTPSVFSLLARLVERAGNWGRGGTITGLYTVLVEGDDMEDPIADAARSLLDGHIVLSRRLANRGHYPSVDILSSVSRVMEQVVDKDQLMAARKVKELSARFLENEDAIQYGMYLKGTDSRIDESIDFEPRIAEFLRQDRDQSVSFSDSRMQLLELLAPGKQE